MTENESATPRFADTLQAHLVDAVVRASGNALHAETIMLDTPPTPALGDFAFRCFGLAAMWKRDVQHVAQDLANALQPTEYIERVQASGPYLNIFLNRTAVARDVLNAIRSDPDAYGTHETASPEIIVLEYISTNTNKPLHIGHLRNGLLGWSVAELLRFQGHEVVKTDIVNDRGIHIVKSMLAYQKWGNGETPQSTGEKPDHFVGRYYVRFDQELKKEEQAWLTEQQIEMTKLSDREKAEIEARFRSASSLWREAQAMLRAWEASDADVRALWKQMNAWALEGIEQTYAVMGFDFDVHDYESQVYEKGKAIVEWAVKDGIFRREANGAVAVPLSRTTNLPDKVVMRSDGTALYMTQDLYLANKRFDQFAFNRCLYVIGSEQKLYLQQLFATLKLLKFPAADRLTHLSYGYVSLPEGRMKSREGTVVDADDLIADMINLAKEEILKRAPDLPHKATDDRARSIALAALKFHFLSVSRESDMVFNPAASLSFEGRTGPYLQYAYARAGSIMRKAGDTALPEVPPVVTNDTEWQIIVQLLHFPRVVSEAATNYEPSLLANYLVETAQVFSTFYHDQPVLQAEHDVRATRLAVVQAFRTILKNGLSMLGIGTLEEM